MLTFKSKLSGIYCWVNMTTGDTYVGQASDLYNRMLSHLSTARRGCHGSAHFQHAWNKYGVDAFSFMVLELCRKDKLILTTREQHWIDRLSPSYNAAPAAGSNLGVRVSAESRAKMSAARKGVPKPTPVSAEHRANLKAACGTPENRERIRNLHLGKPKSPEQRAKMSAWQVGKPKSDETKRRISEALKRRNAYAAASKTT